MNRSAKNDVAAASAWYYATQVALVASGFVSMPIMTRLLSKEDYGLLSLIFASVALFGAFARLGFPQATARFYAEERRKGAARLRDLCDSMVSGALTSSALMALIAIVLLGVAAGGDRPDFIRSMQLACAVGVARVVVSVIYEVYRAQGRVFAYATAQIVARYGTVALAIAFLLTMGRTTYEVVLATAIGEGTVAVVCLIHLAIGGDIGRFGATWQNVRNAIEYGLPLTLVGACSFLVSYGDRFLIERFLGLDAVAKYTVSYNLTENLARSAFVPVQLASVPIIFRLWAEGRRRETSGFISDLATDLVVAAIPIGVLFLILNREIIVLFASSAYGDSASLTPYLIVGVFVGELSFLFACGLRLSKETGIAAAITLFGAALNIVLNIILLPIAGLPGAAVATTVTYATMAAAMYVRSVAVLDLHFATGRIAKSLLATCVMSGVLVGFGPASSAVIVDIGVRGIIGLGLATGSMWVLDGELRARVRSWVRERR